MFAYIVWRLAVGNGEKGNGSIILERNSLIALGGNLTSPCGDPHMTQRAALNSLKNLGAVIRAVSGCYHTPAYPAGAGPDFVNAAAIISANWTPQELLLHLHDIEAEMGRKRDTRWGQRTLDLDLIACGDLVLPDVETFAQWHDLEPGARMAQAPDTLILPHPRLQDRAFVLVPLADIAPDWVHPVTQRSVAQMLSDLPKADIDAVIEMHKPLQ